jgi:transcriptional regulator with XRE-family HTH domain
MDRMLRYRVENARPEDKQKGKPLPQEQAARRADVDSRQWQRWETGETMPHQSNLQQLATKLRIPIAEFYDAEEPEETRGDTPDLGATFNGTVPNDLREQLDRIEEQLADVRGDQQRIIDEQAKTISDLRTVLLRELRRAADARELPTPAQRSGRSAAPAKATSAGRRKARAARSA